MKIKDLIESSISISDTEFVKKFKSPLFHGSHSKVGGVVEFKFRAKSKDTFLPIHHEINALSQQKFGLPIRNLLFCTISEYTADQYGIVKRIAAVGEHRLFFNPEVEDLMEAYSLERSGLLDEAYNYMSRVLSRNDINVSYDHFSAMFSDAEKESQNVHSFKAAMEKFIKEDIKEHQLEIIDAVRQAIRSLKLENKARDYIEGVVEITTDDQLRRSDGNEILMYSPEGIIMELL